MKMELIASILHSPKELFLDEPTIGLHQKDNERLIMTLKKLRDLGNSVLVVEHDREMMMNSDHLLDFGHGAGKEGGEVVFAGNLTEMVKSKKSVTAPYLFGQKTISIPSKPPTGQTEQVTITGCTKHNLKNITVNIPRGKFTVITGVSGSGKSTFLVDTLYPAVHSQLLQAEPTPTSFKRLQGIESLEKAILIDQSPIGRTPRSNAATYVGAFSYIRDLFSQVPESRLYGYKSGRFSFNVKSGRCENCEGQGEEKIEMQFLPPVWVKCEVCGGKRYNEATLAIEYKGKNISEILQMTILEGCDFFRHVPALYQKLKTLNDVGLGYIQVGQSAPTLSGGEAQRVKLASELCKRGAGGNLYILDEPTTGLHFADLEKLLAVLFDLVRLGNTVLIIEHNLEVVKNAQYIVDLGPYGGEKGGYIVASGTPGEIALNSDSCTGQFLKKML